MRYRDTDSGLSTEDYTNSEEEESDTDMSLTDKDRPIVRLLPQVWTDQLTPSVIEDFVDTPPGESKIWQKGGVLAIMWQENKSRKSIRVLSSVSNPTAPVTTVKRKQKDGTLKDISCPEPIKLYNMFMNGVDHIDQMRMEYSIARSCMQKVVDIYILIFGGSFYFKFIYFDERVP